MSTADTHRFRFFVAGEHASGERVALSDSDAKHLRVLRPAPNAMLEIIDDAGTLWEATLDGPEVILGRALPNNVAATRLPRIVLYAGLLEPQRWDVLVDHAVQAGAARIVPVAGTAREATRAVQRVARSERIALSAAKQSKRRLVPPIAQPVTLSDLTTVIGPRIVLDAGDGRPPCTIGDVLGAEAVRQPEIALLVGPAAGIAGEALGELVSAGWETAWLGPTVLRSELAAALAVGTTILAAHALLRG